MQKYINKLHNMYIRIKGSITTLHERLKTVNVDGETPYLMFRTWILDIILHGTLTSTVYTIAAGKDFKTFLLALIVFGIGRWLLLKLIGDARQEFKG